MFDRLRHLIDRSECGVKSAAFRAWNRPDIWALAEPDAVAARERSAAETGNAAHCGVWISSPRPFGSPVKCQQPLP